MPAHAKPKRAREALKYCIITFWYDQINRRRVFRLGSITGLILAIVGGVLYIINGVTTSVSKQALDLITSFFTMQFPAYADILVPIVQWLTGLGGVGVIIGGIVSFVGFKKYGGYIIILSVLGGILSYGTFLYSAQQTGLLSQPLDQIVASIVGLGSGFLATVLSILAYIKR